MFLQKSTPNAASGLMSALPKEVTDQFNDDDKQKLTTTQDNLNRYGLLKKLSEITKIKDIDKLYDLLILCQLALKRMLKLTSVMVLMKKSCFKH